MATFTLRLKDVIDYAPNDGDIGLGVYPIFDETYREPLNTKIINHFWNQEIGVETISVFRFNMARKMNEIMPYYNQLFLSQRIVFDPLSTMNMQTVADSLREARNTNDATSTQNGDNTGKAITVNSDFPQTTLDQNTTGNYASSSTESNSDATSNSTATNTGTEQENSREEGRNLVTGYSGPASDLLQRYRATLLNIDMAVIGDLQELFMSIWDNGDTYTQNGMVL